MQEYPDAAHNLQRIVAFMSERYAGDNRGYYNRAQNFVEYRFDPVDGERRLWAAELTARQKHVVVRFYTPQLRKRGPGIPKRLTGAKSDQTNYALDFEIATDTNLDELGAFLSTTATFPGDGTAPPTRGTARRRSRKASTSTRKRATPVFFTKTIKQAQERAEKELASPIRSEEDGRARELRAVFMRQGQGKFREALIEAYAGRCAVTGSDLVNVLEAAHIIPYKGEYTNRCNNGLLLRGDIHTLFDLGLLWINPKRRIQVASDLRESEYGKLHNKRLAEPSHSDSRPHAEHLKHHEDYARNQQASV